MNRTKLRSLAEEIVFEQEKIDPASELKTVECEAFDISVDQTIGQEVFNGQIAVLEKYADMTVRLDTDTGELVGWNIPLHEKNADSTMIDNLQVQRIVAQAVAIPRDAKILEINYEQEPDAHIATAMWQHMVNDIEVENDCIIALVNSKTRQIISVSKIWNNVNDYDDVITQEQAVEIATKTLPEYGASTEAKVIPVGRKFIPVVHEQEGKKPVCRYVKTWTVIIDDSDDDFEHSTTLAIDTLNGKIVREESSL